MSDKPYTVEILDEPRSGYSYAVDCGSVMYAALFDWEDDAKDYADWMNERVAKAKEAEGKEFTTEQEWLQE
jgi:hypothetical protein